MVWQKTHVTNSDNPGMVMVTNSDSPGMAMLTCSKQWQSRHGNANM